MKTFLLVILIIKINICFSQTKNVTIIGNLSQKFAGEYVSFSKPIGKYTTTYSNINSFDNAFLKDNKFTKTLNVSDSGLIYIFEKPFNGVSSARFFAAPGDTIFIERQNDRVTFKGKNSIVNQLFTDIKLAPVAFNDEVYNLFKNNPDKIIEELNELKKVHFKFYENLLKKKQISKDCLAYIKVVIEHSVDGQAMGIAQDEEFRVEEKMKISKSEAKKFINYYNLKYIKFKNEYLKSPFFLGKIRCSALILEEKALRERKNITRFWNQFDDIFKAKIENIGAIDYLISEDYKETAIGQYFLDLLNSYDNEKIIKFKDLIKVYDAFAEKFPSSSYIYPISKGIMDIEQEKINSNITTSSNLLVKEEPKLIVGKLANYGSTLELFETSPFTEPNQDMLDAIEKKFPNQDLFIDFWATWCGPCIKQFSYKNELDFFLDNNNIKTLYLSVDKEQDALKCEKFINDYNLTGYHFLPSKTYQDNYLKFWGEAIPIYLIYNSKTKKLTKIDGLPIEKEKFYENITKALLLK